MLGVGPGKILEAFFFTMTFSLGRLEFNYKAVSQVQVIAVLISVSGLRNYKKETLRMEYKLLTIYTVHGRGAETPGDEKYEVSTF